MSTYRVEVNNTTTRYITVSADSKQEAIDKVFHEGEGISSDEFYAGSQVVDVKLVDGE